MHGRHQSHREVVRAGDLEQLVDCGLRQWCGQIGRGGDTGPHGQLAKGQQACTVTRHCGLVEADFLEYRRHRLGAFELAIGQAVGAEHDARMIMASSQKTGQLERQGVGIGDVAAGVGHRDRTLCTDAVEVVPVATALSEIDRIEAPADQWLGRARQMRLSLAQSLDHRLDRSGARPDAAIRITAVMKAAVDIAPVDALTDMAVALDETRHDHLVAEALIEIEATPAPEFIEGAGAKDAPVTHRDMGGVGAGRIHGDDAAGGVDDCHGSGGFAVGWQGRLRPPCLPAVRRWPERRNRSRPAPRQCAHRAGQSADRGHRCRAPS